MASSGAAWKSATIPRLIGWRCGFPARACWLRVEDWIAAEPPAGFTDAVPEDRSGTTLAADPTRAIPLTAKHRASTRAGELRIE